LAAAAASVTLPPSLAAAQSSSPDPQDDVAQSTLPTPPPVGGLRRFGSAASPVALGALQPSYHVTDVTVQTGLGPFSLTRSFSGTTRTWAFKQPTNQAQYLGAQPFGASPNQSSSIQWWHNLYSFVALVPAHWESGKWVPPRWQVRDMDGALHQYWACPTGTTSGFCANLDSPETKLYWDAPNTQFIFYKEGAGRAYYGKRWRKTGLNQRDVFMLSSVQRAQYSEPGQPPPVLATLRYPVGVALPTECAYDSQTNPNGIVYDGPPYVTGVTLFGGSQLSFAYTTVPSAATPGARECVLESVQLASPGAPSETVVSFDYDHGQAGLLSAASSSATYTDPGRQNQSYTMSRKTRYAYERKEADGTATPVWGVTSGSTNDGDGTVQLALQTRDASGGFVPVRRRAS
jgi:hypothetical protein